MNDGESYVKLEGSTWTLDDLDDETKSTWKARDGWMDNGAQTLRMEEGDENSHMRLAIAFRVQV